MAARYYHEIFSIRIRFLLEHPEHLEQANLKKWRNTATPRVGKSTLSSAYGSICVILLEQIPEHNSRMAYAMIVNALNKFT